MRFSASSRIQLSVRADICGQTFASLHVRIWESASPG